MGARGEASSVVCAMNVLLTGGCGFLGGHFQERLGRRWNIINVDKLSYAASRWREGAIDCPIEKLTAELLPDVRFDVVVNLASESHVDNSIAGPMEFASNYVGTANILELARKLGIATFVQMSTDEVTGALGPETPPTDELSPIVTSSPYSASKAAAELLALAYHKTYGMDVRIVRSTNLYGSWQHPEKFIPRAITYALSGRSIPLYGDGNQTRDWLEVTEAVRGIYFVITRGIAGRVYCLGAENEIENRYLVEWIAKELDARIEHVADRLGHDFRYATNNSRAKIELGMGPFYRLNSETIKHVILWYRENEPEWRAMIDRGGRW